MNSDPPWLGSRDPFVRNTLLRWPHAPGILGLHPGLRRRRPRAPANRGGGRSRRGRHRLRMRLALGSGEAGELLLVRLDLLGEFARLFLTDPEPLGELGARSLEIIGEVGILANDLRLRRLEIFRDVGTAPGQFLRSLQLVGDFLFIADHLRPFRLELINRLLNVGQFARHRLRRHRTGSGLIELSFALGRGLR